MTGHTSRTVRVPVDPLNPGQFFACCGLQELADRLWKGAEAWFEDGGKAFCLNVETSEATPLLMLIRALAAAGLTGALGPELAAELRELQENRRLLKREGKDLSQQDEVRRTELGTLLRSGAISIGEPFNLLLNWWQNDTNETPKTWAGSQQALRIAKAALAYCEDAFRLPNVFDFACILRPLSGGAEGLDEHSDAEEEGTLGAGKVEPFYFDARRGCHALPIDIGFSPDSLQMTSAAYPAVEFLCLVGLQRFRPLATEVPRVFEYFTWKWPLPLSVTPVAAVGVFDRAVIGGYRFENAFRTDQKKHKAFTAARRILEGETSW